MRDSVMQCAVVCCRVFQCLTVRCSVVLCGAVRCRVIQFNVELTQKIHRQRCWKGPWICLRQAVCCSVLQCVAECCRVVQCAVVCCSVLQCVALSQKALDLLARR